MDTETETLISDVRAHTDRYYCAVAAKTPGGRHEKRLRQRSREFGVACSKSIDRLVTHLRRQSPSAASWNLLEHMLEYQTAFKKSMEMFS